MALAAPILLDRAIEFGIGSGRLASGGGEGVREVAKARRSKAPEARRRRLIAATLTAFDRHGFAAASVARVAALAGVSAGNVHHYFGGKDGLLRAALLALMDELHASSLARLAQAKGPLDRLDAFVEANFADALFTRAICRAWLHFWAEAPHAPALARLEALNRRRNRSNLVAALRQLLPLSAARDLAEEIAATVDGYWLQQAQAASEIAPARARSLLKAQIRRAVAARAGPA